MLHLKMSMFDTFKVKKPQRSTFSLSHKHETTVNIGDINCLHWNWCYPGDRFKIRYSFLAKFAPMIAPNFSRMRIKSEVFYVPIRDIYENFHDVIMNYKEESSTVVENGYKQTFSFTKFPHMLLNRFALYFELTERYVRTSTQSTYFDYLGNSTKFQRFAIDRLIHQIGVPFDICNWNGIDNVTNGPVNPYCDTQKYLDKSVNDTTYFNPFGSEPVSLFPFQAYQYVYNWYYRDSVRSPEVDIYPDVYSRNSYIDTIGFTVDSKSTVELATWVAGHVSGMAYINQFFNSLFQVRRRFYRKDYFNTAVSDPIVGVDSIAVPDNIVDLRKANALQKFIEKRALTGDRVAEWIMSHWATSPDSYEVGKPILISSSSQNVQISEVLQTSETTDDSAQGTRSGNANSYGDSRGSYFVSPDYGVLLINMSIVPEISYFSGTPLKLCRSRWEHFAFPEFAQIGMQPIYQFELASPSPSSSDIVHWATSREQLEDLPVFGYVPRYSQDKMELDQVSGEMATSLRFWHQNPVFKSVPGLNSDFGIIGFFDYNTILSTDEFNTISYYNQIFAVQDDRMADHCQIIANFDITVNRALPANDMPAL